MSADLYSKQLIWAHYWNGHEKLPQNDSSHDEIHPQNQTPVYNSKINYLAVAQCVIWISESTYI